MQKKVTSHAYSPGNAAAGMRMKAWCTVFVLSSMLVACGGEEGDDLDQFIRDSGKGLSGKVEPLPEVKPYVPTVYNPDGSLHDPFRPRKATVRAGGLQPNLDRPREAMEAFPLESLQLVGLIKKGKLKIALLKAPDNNVRQAKIGNYVGQNLGMVVDIIDTVPVEVRIKEIVQDELSGEWTERPASIVQQE